LIDSDGDDGLTAGSLQLIDPAIFIELCWRHDDAQALTTFISRRLHRTHDVCGFGESFESTLRGEESLVGSNAARAQGS
jgi:hypothetical protein